VCVLAGTGGGVQPSIQDGEPDYAGNFDTFVAVSLITTCDVGFQDIPLVAATTTYAATGVQSINIALNAGSEAATFTNPTVLYIDSITVTGATGVGPWTFDADLQMWDINAGNMPVAGSTVTWQGP
jgi:hypothetical protein